jgi:hypothetical protein
MYQAGCRRSAYRTKGPAFVSPPHSVHSPTNSALCNIFLQLYKIARGGEPFLPDLRTPLDHSLKSRSWYILKYQLEVSPNIQGVGCLAGRLRHTVRPPAVTPLFLPSSLRDMQIDSHAPRCPNDAQPCPRPRGLRPACHARQCSYEHSPSPTFTFFRRSSVSLCLRPPNAVLLTTMAGEDGAKEY